MQIADGTVVHFHYTLTNGSGEVLDSSEGGEAFVYLHGAGNIIGGLERAMLGRGAGERFTVDIAPEDAYGLRDDELVQTVPREAFGGVEELEPGMRFQARSESGAAQVVVVTAVDEQSVTVDGNHPLAGVALTFAVEITGVREATEEERSHGHVHEGPHGHHHH